MSLLHGVTTIATAGTDVQATADTRRLLKLWAVQGNGSTGIQYLSDSASARGLEIPWEKAILFDFSTRDNKGASASTVKASDIYFDADTNGDTVAWTMLVA